MIYHKNLSADEIHIVYAFEYSDETARLAATGFAVEDVGKLARQQDDNSLWMLVQVTPTIQWTRAGGVDPADVSDLGGVMIDPDPANSGLDYDETTGELKHLSGAQGAGSAGVPGSTSGSVSGLHYANQIVNVDDVSGLAASDHVIITKSDYDAFSAGGGPADVGTLGAVMVPNEGTSLDGGYTSKGGIQLLTTGTDEGAIYLKPSTDTEIGGIKVVSANGFQLNGSDELEFSSSALTALGLSGVIVTYEVDIPDITVMGGWTLPSGWTGSNPASELVLQHNLAKTPVCIMMLRNYDNAANCSLITGTTSAPFYIGDGSTVPSSLTTHIRVDSSITAAYDPFKLFIQFAL